MVYSSKGFVRNLSSWELTYIRLIYMLTLKFLIYLPAKMALKLVRIIGVLEYDHKVVTIDVYL